MRDKLSLAYRLLRRTFDAYLQDETTRHAAALSYYTIFAIAPLILITTSVAGLIFDRSQAQARVVNEISALIGSEGAEAINGLINRALDPSAGLIATFIALGTLIFGSTLVFASLQGSLDRIWHVKAKPENGITNIIRSRALALMMVIAFGFLLLVSMIISAVLAALSDFMAQIAPGLPLLVRFADLAISFGVVTFFFAMIYKVLPHVQIDWEDVGIGAVFTAILFLIGQWAIGVYLGNSGISSLYGAAGSFVVVLVWVYYSAQILFFGAQFTQVYAQYRGKRLKPDHDAIGLKIAFIESDDAPAEPVNEDADIQQPPVEKTDDDSRQAG